VPCGIGAVEFGKQAGLASILFRNPGRSKIARGPGRNPALERRLFSVQNDPGNLANSQPLHGGRAAPEIGSRAGQAAAEIEKMLGNCRGNDECDAPEGPEER
jgi:hypothetical protein